MPLRLALVAALALAVSLGGASPATAKGCKVPKYPGSGYFLSLNVKGTSCATGKKVALAHHRCRTEDGPKGKCRRKVLRFRCAERRTMIETELNGRVTCRRGGAKVVFGYQQNL